MQKRIINFTGLMDLPNIWRGFFKKSIIGNNYTVLVDDNNRLVMCDSEFEFETNKPLFDLVQSKVNDESIQQVDVLLLGWGIGFVIPHIKNPKVKIHVIEMSQEVLQLTPPDPSITIYPGDINNFDFSLFNGKKFDVIWSDVTDANNKQALYRQYLKPNGKFEMWKAYIQ